MAKRIAYCSDGTWNDPHSLTNVYKLFKALLTDSGQVAYYDDGVGADGTPVDRLTGGAFGEGIFNKIKEGYTKIAHAYETGDEVFLFGFSRGAYTARSLAGMIAICGLPTVPLTDSDDQFVETAFAAYRNPSQRAQLLASLDKYKLFDAKLSMVGVWDTVGALGVPALFGGVGPLLYGFLDTGLHPDVLHAYHALAVNERRQEFPPTLWTSAPAPGQVIEQVWFAGVHCDVGGGYPETGLSDITLSWMMNKAAALGLEFDPAVQAEYATIDAQHALDTIHESWSAMWLFPRPRTIATNSSIGDSVQYRGQHDTTYHPTNLVWSNGSLAASYQIVPVVAAPPPPPPPGCP